MGKNVTGSQQNCSRKLAPLPYHAWSKCRVLPIKALTHRCLVTEEAGWLWCFLRTPAQGESHSI